jgi:hypothetical protein
VLVSGEEESVVKLSDLLGWKRTVSVPRRVSRQIPMSICHRETGSTVSVAGKIGDILRIHPRVISGHNKVAMLRFHLKPLMPLMGVLGCDAFRRISDENDHHPRRVAMPPFMLPFAPRCQTDEI